MDFVRNLRLGPVWKFNIVPLVDMIFLLLLFFLLYVQFVRGASIDVVLPKSVTSQIASGDNLSLVLTSDNIMYLDGQVVTMQDLRDRLRLLSRGTFLLKVDPRASVGRVVEIWDLARRSGVERVNLATGRR